MMKKHNKAPDWSLEPLKSFIDRAERLSSVLRLSVQGMSMIQGVPKAMEAISKATDRNIDVERYNIAVSDVNFVKHEISEGFPVLFGQGVITLWSFLELAVKDLVAAWIDNQSELLGKPPISNMKIKIGDLMTIESGGKGLFFAELIERDVCAGIKQGINRFESFIDVVGLSGEIPKVMKTTFYEFGQIRNALAHYGDRVDRRLVDCCPWLGFKVGQPLKVSEKMFQSYNSAALSYATLLVCRTGQVFGVNMENEKNEIIRMWSD